MDNHDVVSARIAGLAHHTCNRAGHSKCCVRAGCSTVLYKRHRRALQNHRRTQRTRLAMACLKPQASKHASMGPEANVQRGTCAACACAVCVRVCLLGGWFC
eukprot:12786647-Alexandrium_andersonii.AAC.1